MNRLARAIQNNNGIPLLGAAVFGHNPAFLDMAAIMGYKVAWIEMEHTFMTFAQAADLCRIAAGLGMLTMIRINEPSRDAVLKACECGPDILDLPMANTAEIARELVRLARFPPQGDRGFFTLSRATHYNMKGKIADQMRTVNEELCLMGQIETKEAVGHVEEICMVPGLDAIFIGPGDLSASLGVAGETGHPLVKEAAKKVIAAARRHKKQLAVFGPASDFPFWIDNGIDLLFCINDISAQRIGAQSALDSARAAIDKRKKT